MIESDDKITFNPNFETQNSIINEKYIDYSNESIKDFVNNELKAIDNSDTAEKGKEITFCNIDSTEYSDASVSDEESDFEPVNVFIPRFRSTEAFRDYSSLASNKLKNYSNKSLMRCSLPCKKLSVPALNCKNLQMNEENKFSDRKYSYVRQSLNLHNKVHISNFFSTLKK